MAPKNDEVTVGDETGRDPAPLSSSLSEPAGKPLRITCYGSSSSRTPSRYTSEAHRLGLVLARRGHVCVNGAGSSGCMAAMNDGASAGGGHIVGVIHEMFVVDGSDWLQGAHAAFDERGGGGKWGEEGRDGEEEKTADRELLVAGGDDLQERKRLLVEGADALVVLPGGPGTWDELWEMACSRNLGLTDLPIVCINVDGFYEPFRSILERAHNDQLLHKPHHSEIVEIVHFEPSAERAVAWAEEEVARRRRAKEKDGGAGPKRRNPKQVLRKESVMGGSFFFSGSPLGWVRSASWLGGPRDSVEETNSTWQVEGRSKSERGRNAQGGAGSSTKTEVLYWTATFAIGVAAGAAMATARASRIR